MNLPRRLRVGRWPLWSVRRGGREYLIASDLAALVITVLLCLHESVDVSVVARFGVLALLGVGYSEATARLERLTRFVRDGRTSSNNKSVWAFAGLLVLPLGWASALVIVLYGHALLQGLRDQSHRPHRTVFTASTVILAGVCAHRVGALISSDLVSTGPRGAVADGVTLGVFTMVSLGLLIVGMYLVARPPSARVLLPSRDVVGFEIAALLLGLIGGQLVVRTPWLLPILPVLVAILARAALVGELRVSAEIDGKTGLLNAETWRRRADDVLQRAARTAAPVCLLMLDLDHFKTVNDVHGHLMGDKVLRAAADCLKSEVRSYDAVGRYGGEEFVAILDAPTEAGLAVAERVREHIELSTAGAAIPVTVSIGVSSDHGSELDDLVASADAALYAAKRSGRNRVVCAPSRLPVA